MKRKIRLGSSYVDRFIRHETFNTDGKTGVYISTRGHDNGLKYVHLFPFEVDGSYGVKMNYHQLRGLMKILLRELKNITPPPEDHAKLKNSP